MMEIEKWSTIMPQNRIRLGFPTSKSNLEKCRMCCWTCKNAIIISYEGKHCLHPAKLLHNGIYGHNLNKKNHAKQCLHAAKLLHNGLYGHNLNKKNLSCGLHTFIRQGSHSQCLKTGSGKRKAMDDNLVSVLNSFSFQLLPYRGFFSSIHFKLLKDPPLTDTKPQRMVQLFVT